MYFSYNRDILCIHREVCTHPQAAAAAAFRYDYKIL